MAGIGAVSDSPRGISKVLIVMNAVLHVSVSVSVRARVGMP